MVELNGYQKDSKRKQTVLVGMTGRTDSTVAAYLLKKQGFRCIGVSLVFFAEEDKGRDVFQHWNVKDINAVKAICDSLEMPFYGVNAQELYKDKVTGLALASRLAGRAFSPTIYSNMVIIETLASKMKVLNADAIATGHYAKIHRNHKTGESSVMVGNELEHDQAYGLAGIEHHLFDHLLLPLAEMRLSEVEKVSKLLNVKLNPNNRSSQREVMQSSDFANFVEYFSAESLRKPGDLINYQEDTVFCEHNGIHHYFIGKKNNVGNGKSAVPIDPNFEVVDIKPSTGAVYLDLSDDLFHTHCTLKNFICDPNFDTSVPGELYIQFFEGGDKIPCFVYFKNNKNLLIEFKEKQKGLLDSGFYGVLFNKKKGGKVVGGGIVSRTGMVEEEEWLRLPPRDKEKNDNDEEEKQIFHNGPEF